MRFVRPWHRFAAAFLLVFLAAAAAGARGQPDALWPQVLPSGRLHRLPGTARLDPPAGLPSLVPVIGPTSWYDPLDDGSGLSWLDRTQLLTDRLALSLTETLGDEVGTIRALAEGPGGVLYMGTDESRLWSYDPATGATHDLGLPVPDECDN